MLWIDYLEARSLASDSQFQPFAAENAFFAVVIVFWMSSSECATLKKAASNCEGGR